MQTLTPKQKYVLDFTSSFIRSEGFAPSINEIRNNLKLKSVATVHQHLQALERKGYIKREKNQKRHIELIAETPSIIKPLKVVDIPVKKYEILPLKQIICGDAVQELKKMPDNSIDLIVTSPPYDEIRKYNGFSFDLHKTGLELFRVLKDGGV